MLNRRGGGGGGGGGDGSEICSGGGGNDGGSYGSVSGRIRRGRGGCGDILWRWQRQMC